MRQMERVIGSRAFAKAARSQRLLEYLVAASLEEPPQTIKEYTLATEVFDRDPSYDPAITATVRVEAGRMRSRLREYYYDEGKNDPVLIEVPRGGYKVVVTMRPIEIQKPSLHIAEVSEPLTGPEEGVDVPPGSGNFIGSAAKVSQPIAPSTSVARHSVRLYAVPTLVCGVLLAVGVWSWAKQRTHQPAIQSMAVLPLRNLSGDPGQEYFADGTTDELITQLARLPNLRVVSWNSALQEKNTNKSLRVIGAELHADAIVEGSVARSGESVRINAQLIDTRTDEHLWAGSFEGRANDMVGLEDTAAREIVAHMRSVVAPGVRPPEERPAPATTSPAAHEAYLRGRNYFDKRDSLASEREFRHAIELDANYAAAYVGLSLALESQALLGRERWDVVVPRAMAAAEKALQLDPDNGDALIARGSLEAQFFWDWDATRRDLTRGVALSPNDSFGQMMLAIYFDALGQTDEAVKHMQRAVEIDPLSFYMARHYGSTLFFARRYDEALRQLKYAGEMYPAPTGTLNHWITDVYAKKEMYQEAVRYDLLDIPDGTPDANPRRLLATYRTKGWQAYWQMRLDAVRSEQKSDPCRGYVIGLAAIRAGKRDEALEGLKSATDQHCYWMITSRSNPLLDDVRGDARFATILSELHLPDEPRP